MENLEAQLASGHTISPMSNIGVRVNNIYIHTSENGDYSGRCRICVRGPGEAR